MRKDHGKEILTERIASLPSYMTWSAEEVGEILGSFGKIFTSVWSSVKLLTNTLILNAKVIAASVTRDQKAIKAAYEEFSKDRQKYEKETYDNLEYFRKAYSANTIDNLGGFGPKVLAFASNPLLFLSFERSNRIGPDGSGSKFGSESEGESPSDPTPATRTSRRAGAAVAAGAAAGAATTPQLDYALRFFGYEASAPLREQDERAPGVAIQNMSPEETKRAQALMKIAAEGISKEIANIQKVSGILKDRVAVIKSVVEASDFESLDIALAAMQAAGVKTISSGIKTSRKKIEDDLQKQRDENPEQFAEEAKKMRAKAPDIADQDDVQVMMKAAFGSAKSQIQGELIRAYQQIVDESNRTLHLPIDEQTKSMLQKTPLGQQYLGAINNFQTQLESGTAAVTNLSQKV